ncbi:MAG: DUF2341 domain-containing protein [Pseudomonadota bacterium]
MKANHMMKERKKRRVTVMVAMLTVFCCLLIRATAADAWWNEEWQYRKKVTFDTSPTGSDIQENLTDVPLLVKLHSGNFNFTNAREGGEDIRFVSGDDQTLLKHHIEAFDSLEEIALVWVRIPSLSGGGNQDFLYLYYGNAEAVGGQDSGSTYGPGIGAVYNFSGMEDVKDLTANRNHAVDFSGGLGLPAVIGNGMTFNGSGDSFVIKETPSLDFSQGFSISAWIRIPSPMEQVPVISRQSDQYMLEVLIDQTELICRITLKEGKVYETEKAADLALQNWNHITVTASTGGLISVYLDGLKTSYMQLPLGLPNFKGDLAVGTTIKKERFFAGDMDELQIVTRAFTDGWIRGIYASQGPDGNLMQFGEEIMGEGSSSMPLFYLATVFKNITLDGWLVIACLVVLAIMSWMVILSKGLFLYLAEKDNKVFMSAYGQQKEIMGLNGNSSEFQNSSLYRIYHTGCETLKQWIGNPEPRPEGLSSKNVNNFKAKLEKGLIDETRKLNTWLVVLSMAISGGPFLGLLGTVWGVMNTFAAMAEAGEANIMAIAPGVASALSTTVFGLIVAIPALFGYNYLATKIKALTIDLSVFVDELGLKVDDTYGRNS